MRLLSLLLTSTSLQIYKYLGIHVTATVCSDTHSVGVQPVTAQSVQYCPNCISSVVLTTASQLAITSFPYGQINDS